MQIINKAGVITLAFAVGTIGFGTKATKNSEKAVNGKEDLNNTIVTYFSGDDISNTEKELFFTTHDSRVISDDKTRQEVNDTQNEINGQENECDCNCGLALISGLGAIASGIYAADKYREAQEERERLQRYTPQDDLNDDNCQ